jgi:hypothetical protein
MVSRSVKQTDNFTFRQIYTFFLPRAKAVYAAYSQKEIKEMDKKGKNSVA